MRQHRSFPLSALAMLTVLYFVSYYALLKPRGMIGGASIRTADEPHFYFVSRRFKLVFAPAHWVDRKLRPEFWNWP